jgi:integrase
MPRPHGTGGITKRKDGRHQGKYYDENGKAHYVYAKTKAECNRKLLTAIKEARQKSSQPASSQTLGHYLLNWLEKIKAVEYRANSYSQRSYVITRRLIPEFGALRLDAITADHVRDWLIKIGHLKPATISNYYGVIHAALDDAVEDGILAVNPVAKVKLPKKVKPEHTVLNLEQAYKLCSQMAGHWLLPFVQLAIATAMRKGELLSLKWVDIDFAKGVIYVRRNVAYVPRRKSVPGPAKSKSSERTIIMTSFVTEVLKAHKAEQNITRLALGDKWIDNDLVFPNSFGGYRMRHYINIVLDKMLKRAELPRITVHELRHSAVSILLAMGVNIKVIQELCGHSSIVITLDLYGHLLPGAQGQAMNQLDVAWRRQKDVKTGAEEEEKEA